jgi:hypothetical protein
VGIQSSLTTRRVFMALVYHAAGALFSAGWGIFWQLQVLAPPRWITACGPYQRPASCHIVDVGEQHVRCSDANPDANPSGH